MLPGSRNLLKRGVAKLVALLFAFFLVLTSSMSSLFLVGPGYVLMLKGGKIAVKINYLRGEIEEVIYNGFPVIKKPVVMAVYIHGKKKVKKLEIRNFYPVVSTGEELILTGKKVDIYFKVEGERLFLESRVKPVGEGDYISISVRFPLDGVEGVWAPFSRAIYVKPPLKRLRYRYEVYLPAVALIKRNKTILVGVTPYARAPKLEFRFNGDNLVVTATNFRVNRVNNLPITIVIQEGGEIDKAVAKFLSPFQTMDVVNKAKLKECLGAWWCTAPEDITDDSLKVARDLGVKIVELHEYFPFYGSYAPSTRQWRSLRGETVTWNLLIKKIELCHSYGMKVFIYLDITECQYEVARSVFRRDLLLDEKGCVIKGFWREERKEEQTYIVNPRSGSFFLSYLKEQLISLLDRLPVDGVFLDRCDYSMFEYNHDDGISSTEHGPCYMVNFAVEEAVMELAEIARRRGKLVMLNLPVSVETALTGDIISRDYTCRFEPEKTLFQAFSKPCYLMYVGEDLTNLTKQLSLLNRYCVNGVLPGFDSRLMSYLVALRRVAPQRYESFVKEWGGRLELAVKNALKRSLKNKDAFREKSNLNA